MRFSHALASHAWPVTLHFSVQNWLVEKVKTLLKMGKNAVRCLGDVPNTFAKAKSVQIGNRGLIFETLKHAILNRVAQSDACHRVCCCECTKGAGNFGWPLILARCQAGTSPRTALPAKPKYPLHAR